MFSRILVKLIDQAILPAIVLLSIRVISVILISKYYDINFDITTSGFSFTNASDYIMVNSYSTFAIIVILTIGLFYILLKSFIFHESHVSPKLTAELYAYKLDSLIQKSYDLYSQGTIWLSYTYLMMIISGVLAAFGLMYPWVFYVSLVLCLISTILLIFDIENEINIKKSLDTVQYDRDTDELGGGQDE